VSETTKYVTYYVAPQQKSGLQRNESIVSNMHSLFSLPSNQSKPGSPQAEHSSIAEFINSRIPKGEIIASFTENPENRRTA
jgi:hypothetical protein